MFLPKSFSLRMSIHIFLRMQAVDLWSILEDEEEDYGLVTYSINWNSPESEEVNLNSNALLNFSWIG